MKNTNCLEGIACPKCGKDHRIYIAAKTLADVTDEGAEAHGDMEWDDDSDAECPACGFSGRLEDFYEWVEVSEDERARIVKEARQ